MTGNPFEDQAKFMEACDQTVGEMNIDQFAMYCTLIAEEAGELSQALREQNKVEILDALIDILVVATGAAHSMNVNVQDAWNEVMKTNFAKIDPDTGKVTKREDGKVLKPEGWKAPELERLFTE